MAVSYLKWYLECFKQYKYLGVIIENTWMINDAEQEPIGHY